MLGDCECLQPQCIWHSWHSNAIDNPPGFVAERVCALLHPFPEYLQIIPAGEGAGGKGRSRVASMNFCSAGSVLVGCSPFFPKGSSVDGLPGLGALHLVFF